MHLVIDTNVLVSALLTPTGTAARLVNVIRDKRTSPVISHDVYMEYEEVLSRAKFGFMSEQIGALLDDLMLLGLYVCPPSLDVPALPDPDDAPFIAVARHARCPLVTGSARHFPPDTGVEILSPAEALARLGA